MYIQWALQESSVLPDEIFAVVLSLTCPSLSLVVLILLMLSADCDPSNPAIRAQTLYCTHFHN